MGTAKEKLKDYLVLLLLAIFPFGQLPGIFSEFVLQLPLKIHLVDALVIFITIFTGDLPNIKKLFVKYRYVFVVLFFSSIISFFSNNHSIVGILYLARLIFYLLFLLKWLDKPFSLNVGNLILRSLLIVGFSVSFLGWVQYLFIPDLISLKYFGWDDHYFRLSSTFLDPAFTGILIVFSVLLSIYMYIRSSKKSYLVLTFFFLITLGFTYSRASFLALFIGLLFLLFKKQKKLFLVLSICLVFMMPLLPRNAGGEGVKLTRTASSMQKIDNFQDSLAIINTSPLFGVGYNNICKAKQNLNIDVVKQENSCWGLDNSFLLILATTGVLGFISFLYLAFRIYELNAHSSLLIASFASLVIHTLFTNTLFYPWVLVWVAFLIGSRNALRSKL